MLPLIPNNGGANSSSVNSNGVAGINLVLTFRADWQSRYNHTTGSRDQSDFTWNRFYAYRFLSELRLNLYQKTNIFKYF